MPVTLLLLVIVCAYGMGFVAAIPVGATQLEVARRALRGNIAAALMIALGAITSDAMYGVIAFVGVVPFLQDPNVVSIFWLIGGIMSLVLGTWIIRSAHKHHPAVRTTILAFDTLRLSYLTGFSLAVTNPMMIAWWLLGSQALRDLHIVERFDLPTTAAFLLFGVAGIFSYQCLLTLGISRARSFFSERTIQKISVTFGYMLCGLGALLLGRAAWQLS